MILWDEITGPDVEMAPRMYCCECRCRTLFDFYDGERVCRGCAEEMQEVES